MYLGNIGPVSDLEYLVKFFIDLNLNSCRLIIAGSGSCKNDLISLANNNSKIEFWEVPAGQVSKIQSYADVLILPQKKKTGDTSVPSKLPAYMFSKKPVLSIVDGNSAVAKIINDAKCGFVVEPRNSLELKSCFNNILNLPKDKLIKMGLNGFNYSLKNFSKNGNLKLVVNVFNSVMSS